MEFSDLKAILKGTSIKGAIKVSVGRGDGIEKEMVNLRGEC